MTIGVQSLVCFHGKWSFVGKRWQAQVLNGSRFTAARLLIDAMRNAQATKQDTSYRVVEITNGRAGESLIEFNG